MIYQIQNIQMKSDKLSTYWFLKVHNKHGKGLIGDSFENLYSKQIDGLVQERRNSNAKAMENVFLALTNRNDVRYI